jgi:type IV pilus assembly protein PilP
MKRLPAIAVGLLAACGSPTPATKPAAKSAAIKPAAKAAVPEQAAAPAEEIYTYSAIGKRDPFRSPLDDLVVQGEADSQCPLCKWEIDQLRLVAVVTGTGNPVAMVEDPDGVGHVVRQGTQVGRRNGKVTTIRRDEVVVAELAHDPFGKAISNKTILKIARNPSDAPQPASLLDE